MAKKRTGILSRNGKNIQMCIPYNGARIYETLQIPPTGANLNAAESKRSIIINELKNGIFNYKSHFIDGDNEAKFIGSNKSSKIIGDRLDELLIKINKNESYKKSTIADLTKIIKAIKKLYGSRCITSITTADLKSWAKKQNVKQKTLNNRLRIWNLLIEDARSDGLMFKNILDGWKPTAEKTGIFRKQPFSQNEVSKILDSMKKVAPEMYSLTLFRFSLGLRPGELFGLTWDKFSETDNSILINESVVSGIHESETKTPAGLRRLKLNSSALKAITIQKALTYETGGLIFTFNDSRTSGMWTYQSFGNNWKMALKHAGVKYRAPYTTRHTYATLSLTGKNKDLYAVSIALGHADMSTTSRAYVGTIKEGEAIETDFIDFE